MGDYYFYVLFYSRKVDKIIIIIMKMEKLCLKAILKKANQKEKVDLVRNEHK